MHGDFLENCPVFFDERPHAIRFHARIIELIQQEAVETLLIKTRLINEKGKNYLKYLLILAMVTLMISGQAYTQIKQKEQLKKTEEMEQITPKGYTTFQVRDNVTMYKVTFKNQYKMNVAGHLFIPKNLDRSKKHSAIVVGHPMGSVKEQSANVYAANMAERGFVTLSLDLSFWGESEGEPRNAVAPDIYSEDFSAAVDFLGTRPFVDRNRIGIIGICGSGSFVISAAKIDPRMKAIATVSMYDMEGKMA
ncbi:hypothetical protein NUACC26_004410 [Scytonema sp. NUACC26]